MPHYSLCVFHGHSIATEPAANYVTSVHTASRFVAVTNNNAEKCGTPFEGEVHPESHISGHTLCNYYSFFNK